MDHLQLSKVLEIDMKTGKVTDFRKPQVEDFDQTIYLIDQMIASGEDIWQIATDAANYEESETDKRRWNQCDIAARIVKKYGDDAIGKFAVDANIPRRRAQEYRTMGTFWYERSARAQFLKDNPNTLTYSHLRLAARMFPDAETAMKWLERCERKSRSVDACEYIWTRAKRIYGPPQGNSAVDDIWQEHATFELPAGKVATKLMELHIDPAEIIKVTVYKRKATP